MTGVAVRRGRLRLDGCVLAAAGAIALLLVGDRHLPIGISIVAIGVPVVAWLALSRAERDGDACDPRLLATAIGAVLLLAISLPPKGSQDLWSYVMYGRMITSHASNPYLHVPAEFRADPFLGRVATGWRHTPSVYGPLFSAIAALGTFLAGGSALVARLFHQGLAALAVVVALRLIWRETRSTAAVALVGLNPLVIVSVVNGGHNDALVGLAVLGATLLAMKGRAGSAGVVLACGALIKFTALLAAPALLVWVAYRFGRQAAARFAGFTVACVAGAYALSGPAAITALGTNRDLLSRASPWNVAVALLGGNRAGHGGAHWLPVLALGSVLAVGALVIGIAWRGRRDVDVATVVALSIAAYLVVGMYVLPWYVVWMLPVAAVSLRRSTQLFALLLCAFLPIVYAIKARAEPHSVGVGWHLLGSSIGPLLVVVAFGIVVLTRTAPATTSADRSTATPARN